jgi:hypothetical protein
MTGPDRCTGGNAKLDPGVNAMRRLLLAAASLAAIACSDATGNGAAHTSVYLTDSPFPFGSIAQVNVYIARIEASASTDTTGLDLASWVTIATPERTFNLLDFQGGAATLLGEADLPADRYAAVRVVINTARSSVVRTDGSQATVHWPISGDLSLYALVEEPLAVTASGAQIVIDFDVGRTFLPDGTGGFYLVPWIRAVNEAATGRITGTVTATSIEGETIPFVNAAVAVYRVPVDPPGQRWMLTTLPLGTGRTDAQGHYTVAFLPAGYYAVVATDPAFPQRWGRLWGAQVTVGGSTGVNLLMLVDTTGGTDTTGVDSTGAPTGPVARVSISPLTQTISVGDSAGAIAMTYNAQSQMLSGRTVTWTVADSAVVRVTQAAYNWILLRGARSGTTTLTATSEGMSGTAAVTVR